MFLMTSRQMTSTEALQGREEGRKDMIDIQTLVPTIIYETLPNEICPSNGQFGCNMQPGFAYSSAKAARSLMTTDTCNSFSRSDVIRGVRCCTKVFTTNKSITKIDIQLIFTVFCNCIFVLFILRLILHFIVDSNTMSCKYSCPTFVVPICKLHGLGCNASHLKTWPISQFFFGHIGRFHGPYRMMMENIRRIY